MSKQDEDEQPQYRLEFTDVAQGEAEAAYLRRSVVVSHEKAYEWFIGIYDTAKRILFMPRMYQRIETKRYQGEVRRMLYGRGQGAYKIIYRVIDPVDDDEGVVRVLRFMPATQSLEGDE